MSGDFVRWEFIDPTAALSTYVFHVNPNAMSDPTLKKNTQAFGFSPIRAHKNRGIRTNRLTPREWTFSGVTIVEAQQVAFETWYNTGRRIQIRDHFNRVWEARLTKYDVRPRRSTKNNLLWRFTYTFTANVYRRVS